MSAREIIAGAVRNGRRSGLADADVTGNVLVALRADPAAVLALLPDEVLADIGICALYTAETRFKHDPGQGAGADILALLGKARES